MPVNPRSQSTANHQFSAEDRTMLDEIKSLFAKLTDPKSTVKEQRDASKKLSAFGFL
jgi:hypothetical protein